MTRQVARPMLLVWLMAPLRIRHLAEHVPKVPWLRSNLLLLAALIPIRKVPTEQTVPVQQPVPMQKKFRTLPTSTAMQEPGTIPPRIRWAG